MSFTDDDLKRLKEEIEDGFYGSNRDRLNALLARLEAAEKLISLRGVRIQMERNDRKIETAAWAWRKAAGKV